jgi:hypothetical protein
VLNFVRAGTPVFSVDLTTSRVIVPGASDSIVFNASATGNNSVDLPANAISSFEMLDEPGAAQSVNAGSVSLITNGVLVPLSTRTITCPAAGYILAIASAEVLIPHTTSSTDLLTFGVSLTSSSLDADQSKQLQLSTSIPAGTFSYIVSSQKIFPAVPGANLVWALGRKDLGLNNHSIENITLSILYVPTSYGTVSTLVSESEAGSFESAEATIIRQSNQDGSYSEQVLYEVDLRELEVKAARLQAEAERAERELAEARLSAQGEEVSLDPADHVAPR